MKFTASLPELQRALQNAVQAVAAKSTIPVLENFQFSLSSNDLSITATDTEITVITKLSVEGEQDGQILIPARKLFDITKALGNVGKISLSADHKTLKATVKTEYGEYVMSGSDAGEFPKPPSLSGGVEVHLSAQETTMIAEKVTFAVSKDEYRPAMTGVLFQFRNQTLNAVTTDGYRLVRIMVQPNAATIMPTDATDAIIPVRAIELLRKVAHDVTARITKTHAQFVAESLTVITRLIDEKFPAYENVIPTDNDKIVMFRPADVIASIKRVSLFSNSTSKQIRFMLDVDRWVIAAEDVDTGQKAQESVPCSYNGDKFEIGFNHRYIEEAISHLDNLNNNAVISFSSPTRAALIKAIEAGETQENVLMLVMPVRL
jgi:DNA polymerase-3 subunit beta